MKDGLTDVFFEMMDKRSEYNEIWNELKSAGVDESVLATVAVLELRVARMAYAIGAGLSPELTQEFAERVNAQMAQEMEFVAGVDDPSMNAIGASLTEQRWGEVAAQ